MASSLSNLAGNLKEGIHKIKCKDWDCCLEYESVKGNLIKYKFLSCNKDYSNKFDKELRKKLKNTFKFYNNDINKFILLIRNYVYPYECIGNCEKFNKTKLPEKEDFYSNLNMKELTDADYMYGKRICKGFEIKNLGEYHDLYLKSDTLLLTHIFKNLRKMCIKMYELDLAKFLSAPGLASQMALKKTKVKLKFLTDIFILLMVEKRNKEGICNAIHSYAKANNKYIRDYDKK